MKGERWTLAGDVAIAFFVMAIAQGLLLNVALFGNFLTASLACAARHYGQQDETLTPPAQ